MLQTLRYLTQDHLLTLSVSQSQPFVQPQVSLKANRMVKCFTEGTSEKYFTTRKDFFILCELLQLPTAMVTFESLNSIVYFENFKFIVISEALTSMISFALQL